MASDVIQRVIDIGKLNLLKVGTLCQRAVAQRFEREFFRGWKVICDRFLRCFEFRSGEKVGDDGEALVAELGQMFISNGHG
jgi:hypothetical protein